MGEQDVDYAYAGNAAPPSTGEIARHFAPLNAQEQARVTEYCRRELVARYGDIEAGSVYFDRPRVWRLSLFDHAGQACHYHYRLEGDSAELLDGAAGPLGWSTEVPAAKLYAALELGESLTSMYMRINDERFAPDAERELMDADLVDDPLIRCLFGDTFGAYQAAQLRRLLAR